jgi:aspartyl-tRNA(Asn)/glutamyl-tRNA(Gln) amidotransferase subunit B
MEKGSMRCDANVSIRPVGQTTLGTRAEVKNMNSMRSVRDAVAHEMARQIQVVESGGAGGSGNPVVEPRRRRHPFHAVQGRGPRLPLFPGPGFGARGIVGRWMETLRKIVPELPEARCARYERSLGLSAYDAAVLTAEKTLADFFETALNRFEEPIARRDAAKPLTNWLTTELLGRLNAQRKTLDESPVSSAHLADLVKLILKGVINSKAAKVVFDHMFTEGGDPETIVKAKGLVQVDDEAEIARWVDEVVAANPKIVADIQGGKAGAVGSWWAKS